MGHKQSKSKKNLKANFEAYCEANCIHNEYTFWRLASQFQTRRHWESKGEMKQTAKDIFDKFIQEGGANEVCIGAREKTAIIKELENPSYKIFQESLLQMSALLMHHLVNFKRINGITDDDDMGSLSPAARKEETRASSAGTATRTDSARTNGSADSAHVEDEEDRGKRSVVLPKSTVVAVADVDSTPRKRRVAKQNSKKRLRRQNTDGVRVRRQRRV